MLFYFNRNLEEQFFTYFNIQVLNILLYSDLQSRLGIKKILGLFMKSFIKLIYRSNMTYLTSIIPVQFYGLPDGKVYVIYSRFYEIEFDRSYLEFVFAEHKEFSYDYENEKLIPHDSAKRKAPIYNEMVDKPDPKIKILNIYRNINSYAEACAELNKKAHKMFENRMKKSESKVQDIGNKGFTATG